MKNEEIEQLTGSTLYSVILDESSLTALKRIISIILISAFVLALCTVIMNSYNFGNLSSNMLKAINVVEQESTAQCAEPRALDEAPKACYLAKGHVSDYLRQATLPSSLLDYRSAKRARDQFDATLLSMKTEASSEIKPELSEIHRFVQTKDDYLTYELVELLMKIILLMMLVSPTVWVVVIIINFIVYLKYRPVTHEERTQYSKAVEVRLEVEIDLPDRSNR